MDDERVVQQVRKKIGVIEGPNFLRLYQNGLRDKMTKEDGEFAGGLNVLPIVFTCDRTLIGRTSEVVTDYGAKAVVIFEGVENLVKYVPYADVAVKVSRNATPFTYKDLLVRDTVVVMDSSLAEQIGVTIRDCTTLQYAKISAVGRVLRQ